MLRIDRLTLREIRMPLREPFAISSGMVHERRICLLQLRHPDGLVSWAECVADEMPNYSPETIDTAWYAIKAWIAPRVLGKTFHSSAEIFNALEENIRGHRMAKAAVEMGMWELAARLQEMPLAKVLGGARTEIATGISLGIQNNPEALVAKARAAQAQGYRKIKVKIKPGADVEYVAAVREALGPEAHLMADANNAYSLHDVQVLKQLDAFDLIMLEQPLAWDDIVQHATLQRQLKTPICLDESITGVDKAEDMVKLGSGKIINIKPGRVGGFASSKAIHDFCAQHNIPVWCGGMLESGVGRAYNVALAALPNFILPGDLSPSARYWEQDIVTPEWTMDARGMVQVPLAQPGMGVTVNLDRVDDLTVRVETLMAR
ncbi:o-succinylbenzoate synthase [candidate division KSB1 bacterium]|nr:o-succinylbenzoate synthase [candidate division KSB1 bacterium]